MNCAKTSACLAFPILCMPHKSPCFLTKEPDLEKGSQCKSMLIHVTPLLCLYSGWLLADSSGSDSELQTPAEARFWDQKLSPCYTNSLPALFSGFCLNWSCLIRVFQQRFFFKQYAAWPSTEAFVWPSFDFHNFSQSFRQQIKSAIIAKQFIKAS